MAYHYAPTPGYQYAAATPGYQFAPAAQGYQQAPPGYVLVPVPQQQQAAVATYQVPPTGLTPGYAAYPRTPAAPIPGFGLGISYQQPQVWPGVQQARTGLTPGYWPVATPGFGTGLTPYPYARTGRTPYPHARTGQTPAQYVRTGLTPQNPYARTGQTPAQYIRTGQTRGFPGQNRQTPAPSQQRSARPGLTPAEPSYFRGHPNRSGQTPAVPTPKSAPPSGPTLRPLGTPARPTPGPSRLREVTSNDAQQDKFPSDIWTVGDVLEHLSKLDKSKGKQGMIKNDRELLDWLERVAADQKRKDAEKEASATGAAEESSRQDCACGKESSGTGEKAPESTTAEAAIEPAIRGLSPDIFVEDEDEGIVSGGHVAAS